MTWKPVMLRLCERFDFIAPDLRGFGDSDKPAGDFGPSGHVLDVVAVIAIAQTLARTRPDIVAGLFFFNFMYPGIGDRYNSPDHLRFISQAYFNQSELAVPLLRASTQGVRLFVTHFVRLWALRPEVFDNGFLDELVANMEKPSNLEGGFTSYRSMFKRRAREHGGDLPPSIPLPTCIRWAECDRALKLD